MPELLTTREVAGILRYHQKWVETLCRQGKLPATMVRHRWRIRRETVEAMLREGGES